jgi:uncharacterized protein
MRQSLLSNQRCQNKVAGMHFEIWRDRKGEFRWRIVASNGRILASSEGYTSKSGCLNAIETVKRYAARAEVADRS